MKRQQVYRKIIIWIALFGLGIVCSGLWLYLLHTQALHHLYSHTIEVSLEIAVPHLIGMGVVAFVVLHFFLFVKIIPQKLIITASVILYSIILIDQMLLFFHSEWLKQFFVFTLAILFVIVLLLLLYLTMDEERIRSLKKA